MAKKITKTITLAYAKSTPGTHVYSGENDVVKTIYIQRSALGAGDPPATCTATLVFE